MGGATSPDIRKSSDTPTALPVHLKSFLYQIVNRVIRFFCEKAVLTRRVNTAHWEVEIVDPCLA